MNENKRKLYNPNSFNALDAALCFLAIILTFIVLDNLMALVIAKIRANAESFDYFAALCVSAIITQAAIFGVAILFCKIKRVNVFSGGGFVYKFDFVQILFALTLSLGVALTFVYAHEVFSANAFELVYGYEFAEYEEKLNESLTGNYGFLLLEAFILTPLLPAICEEVLFRGVIMRGLRQFGVMASVILSSLCFTFMHGNVYQILLQFILGLTIATVVSLTKNFMLGAVMHFTHNLFVTLFEILKNYYGLFAVNGEYLMEIILIIFGVVFIIIGGYYFIKLAINNSVKRALDKPVALSLSDAKTFAKIKKENEPYQVLYPAQIDFENLTNAAYYYELDGKEYKINKKANKTVAIVTLTIGLILSLIIIFI